MQPLRAAFPQVRWIAPELLHLTLVFLGQTDAARVAGIEARLREVAVRHPSYATAIAGAGGLVDEHPDARRRGVGWLSLGDGAGETARLAIDIDEAIDARTYDARRRPRPHLTVARNVSADALAALREFAPRLAVRWTTDRIVLFRSHTAPRGSRYVPLAIVPLRQDA